MMDKALKILSRKADEAEVFRIDQRSASIKTKKHDVDSFKEKHSLGYGIRVIKAKRMGFYFTSKLDEQALEEVLNIARVAQPDEHHKFPKGSAKTADDHALFHMDEEEGMVMAKEMLRATEEYKDVAPTTGALSWDTTAISIANTNGVEGEKTDSTLSLYLGTVARAGDTATGFHFEISRKKDIDPSDVGDRASMLARDSLNAGRLETGRMPVILRPMAMTELLEYTLIPSFSADNVQRGRSKLADNLGGEVFKDISIWDDSTYKEGLMTEPFDDEGVAAQRTTLVEKGVLKGFLYDAYTAGKGSVESTGNGVRSSHASLPQVGPSNFIFEGSQEIEEEEDALVVHGLIGAHTSNPISGDFSCETRNAFFKGRPIKKAIVSGNIFEVLRAGIRLGRDVEQYSSILSPSMEIPDITVVG